VRFGWGGDGVRHFEESLLFSFFETKVWGGVGKALFLKLLERLQGFEEAPLAGGGVAMREAGLLVDWPDNVPG